MPQRCICRQSNLGVANPYGRHLDIPRLLAAEDANGDGRRLPASLLNGEHWTTDNLTGEEGLVIRKDRRVGDSMEPGQRSVALVHDTGRIDDHQLPEDRGMRRQRRGLFQNVVERQIIGPRKCDAVGKRRYFPADFLLPKLFNGRGADDHHDMFLVSGSTCRMFFMASR